MPNATNDHLIVYGLRLGHFTVNPETGWVLGRARKPVGSVAPTGYVRISYAGTFLLAHRVVWIAENGPIATDIEINHRNRRRWDNRLVNLEAVTHQQNHAHATRHRSYIKPIPADIQAVDPSWLARALDLAADEDATPEQIKALVGGPRRDRDDPYAGVKDKFLHFR